MEEWELRVSCSDVVLNKEQFVIYHKTRVEIKCKVTLTNTSEHSSGNIIVYDRNFYDSNNITVDNVVFNSGEIKYNKDRKGFLETIFSKDSLEGYESFEQQYSVILSGFQKSGEYVINNILSGETQNIRKSSREFIPIKIAEIKSELKADISKEGVYRIILQVDFESGSPEEKIFLEGDFKIPKDIGIQFLKIQGFQAIDKESGENIYTREDVVASDILLKVDQLIQKNTRNIYRIYFKLTGLNVLDHREIVFSLKKPYGNHNLLLRSSDFQKKAIIKLSGEMRKNMR